jgi:hypothetical protein
MALQQKAIEVLRRKGGVLRVDPNASWTQSAKKRRGWKGALTFHCRNPPISAVDHSASAIGESETKTVEGGLEGGLVKRVKLGEMSFTDGEIRAMLAKKSSHEWELAKVLPLLCRCVTL